VPPSLGNSREPDHPAVGLSIRVFSFLAGRRGAKPAWPTAVANLSSLFWPLPGGGESNWWGSWAGPLQFKGIQVNTQIFGQKSSRIYQVYKLKKHKNTRGHTASCKPSSQCLWTVAVAQLLLRSPALKTIAQMSRPQFPKLNRHARPTLERTRQTTAMERRRTTTAESRRRCGTAAGERVCAVSFSSRLLVSGFPLRMSVRSWLCLPLRPGLRRLPPLLSSEVSLSWEWDNHCSSLSISIVTIIWRN
jgi:hypothetical protein